MTRLNGDTFVAFRNNDSMGALLAWRGWSVGNRLSVYDEVLPLPPLTTLRCTNLQFTSPIIRRT